MEKQQLKTAAKRNQQEASQPLHWGAHNPKLTASNFIGPRAKKMGNQNETLTNAEAPMQTGGIERGA